MNNNVQVYTLYTSHLSARKTRKWQNRVWKTTTRVRGHSYSNVNRL